MNTSHHFQLFQLRKREYANKTPGTLKEDMLPMSNWYHDMAIIFKHAEEMLLTTTTFSHATRHRLTELSFLPEGPHNPHYGKSIH